MLFNQTRRHADGENTSNQRASLPAAGLIGGIFDAIPGYVAYCEPVFYPETDTVVDWVYRVANARLNSLVHPPGGSVVGHTLRELFPDLPTGDFLSHCTVAFLQKQAVSFEFSYRIGTEETWFLAGAEPHDDGLVLSWTDITQQKKAISEGPLSSVVQAILDYSQTAVALHEVVYDQAHRIVDFQTVQANKQALVNWGAHGQARLRESLLTLEPQARESGEFDRLVRVATTGEPESYELAYNDRLYAVTVARADKGVVTSAVDITIDRQYRHQLEAMNQSLRQSNENLQSFAYVASHDLQEPLRKIQTFSDILQNQFEDNLSDGERDMTRRIQKSARRMQMLIKDLLAYSQLAGRREAHQPVRLNEIVNEVVSDLEIGIAEKKATVEVAALPVVRGSAFRLRQLMQNLLANALKFAGANRPPVVQINARPAQSDDLPADLPRSNSYWLITVADNGIGFDEKYKGRIFQPFQRLHDPADYTGTGIGLAICQRVVESHGGAIDVNSVPDVGTTFKVFLPVD
ncbi:hypothetical protein F5984_11915 [Rudanella paleaurantiibacter]|uniref:histidine kinase n=1 Tax=Rudanella paleaurantiibacter TaxID=2614655 RepID=A0A7J5U022_9BACT|nr:ATP-binding protein [Rudanella paleaurantiibacter]KAB7730845.1 hypothetical protein F5984_11915 [Rudanella paleaurantiibacter]